MFKDLLRREGLESEAFIDFAGTGSWHVGEPPDPRALESARKRGLDLNSQRARRISPEDCQNFAYILTMDEENYRAVASLCRGNAVVRPFLGFAVDSPHTEVPDPYYGDAGGFEHALDPIEEAAQGLLWDIRTRYLESRV